jgi:hypothetical protein
MRDLRIEQNKAGSEVDDFDWAHAGIDHDAHHGPRLVVEVIKRAGP